MGIDLSDVRPAVAEVDKMVLRHTVQRVRRVLPRKHPNPLGKLN
jgi:hypothetical protein